MSETLEVGDSYARLLKTTVFSYIEMLPNTIILSTGQYVRDFKDRLKCIDAGGEIDIDELVGLVLDCITDLESGYENLMMLVSDLSELYFVSFSFADIKRITNAVTKLGIDIIEYLGYLNMYAPVSPNVYVVDRMIFDDTILKVLQN